MEKHHCVFKNLDLTLWVNYFFSPPTRQQFPPSWLNIQPTILIMAQTQHQKTDGQRALMY